MDVKSCRGGSCQRHQKCRYRPCRHEAVKTPPLPASDRVAVVAWLHAQAARAMTPAPRKSVYCRMESKLGLAPMTTETPQGDR